MQISRLFAKCQRESETANCAELNVIVHKFNAGEQSILRTLISKIINGGNSQS